MKRVYTDFWMLVRQESKSTAHILEYSTKLVGPFFRLTYTAETGRVFTVTGMRTLTGHYLVPLGQSKVDQLIYVGELLRTKVPEDVAADILGIPLTKYQALVNELNRRS